MTDEQKAAYINAQAMCAYIEAQGMIAENQHRTNCGNSITYGKDEFDSLIEKYGIYHNAILDVFRDWP